MFLYIRGEVRMVTCQTDDIGYLGTRTRGNQMFSIYVNALLHNTYCFWNKKHFLKSVLIKEELQGAWVAQLVKHLTLDFGSGHDFAVLEIKPCFGLCTDSTERLLGILSLPFCLPLARSCTYFLKTLK